MEAAAVFEDTFFGVPFGVAEIKNFFAALIADAAGFCAEAVDEPGNFCKSGHLQDSEPVGFAFGPLLIESRGRDRQECLSHQREFAFGLT